MLQIVFAESEQPSPVAQQSVLIASKMTDIVDNKYVSGLNITQLHSRESLAVEKLYSLHILSHEFQ